ncbi:MAG TPA: tetratricopeptide repeat protein [Terracidiphilus sp.]|nr:tetratricopeptide repeat protein [Terracidiphilus sp.]
MAAQSPTTSQPVSAQVLAAESAIAGNDLKSAQASLESYIAAHPNDERALFDLGYVADAQNRLDDAADLYRKAIAANPKSFEAHLSLGLLLAREGKLDEARPELVTATTLDPGAAGPALKARAWRALAQIDKPRPDGDNDPTQASSDLIEALKISPETESDTLLAASLAEDAGEYDNAEGAYRRVLAKDPKSEQATTSLAHLLLARKQYSEAETMLRAALQQFPGDPTLTAQLATVLVAEDKADALPLLEQLHTSHPDDTSITRMLAIVEADAGDYDASDKLFAELLQKNPQDPELLVGHGQNLVHQQRYAEAFAAFDEATQADQTSVDGWSGLAFTAERLGRPEVTLRALAERSKYLPDIASTYFLWAVSYDKLNQKKQAIDYYQRFLEASAGKAPDQEWQARQRLQVLKK